MCYQQRIAKLQMQSTQDPSSIERELFRKLFDAAPDPIVIVNDQGVITLVNGETERKFGYKAEELEDQALEILLPERFRRGHVERRTNYMKAPRTRPMGMGIELYARKQDGSEFPVEISLSPLHMADSHFTIGIIRDISDRKSVDEALRLKAMQLERMNLELARSNAELEQFAYIASHDLQEPLRSIAGSCQLLQRRIGDKLDGESQEFINFAVDGAKRMQALITDLLAYSRVTTKAKEPVRTDLEDVFSRVITSLRQSIEDQHATITHEPLPTVMADPTQMVLLFQNLVANSLKFHGQEPPTVQVSAVREGEHWHFQVRDNGIGIDPEYFDKIFVVFNRLHSRDEYPGTGIGLASCKKIVERHNGRIWLESVLGQGTTFHFTLPADEASS